MKLPGNAKNVLSGYENSSLACSMAFSPSMFLEKCNDYRGSRAR